MQLNLMPQIQAVNPYHQALQTGLQDYMNITKAAYQPQSMQADIASKAAYATYSPYSYISKALSDPTTAMLLAQHPEQLNALTSKFANMPTDPYSSLQTGHQSLWDRLKEWTGLSQPKTETTENPQQAPQDQTGQSQKPADLNAKTPIVTAGGTPVGFSYTPSNLYQQNYIKQFPNSREALNVTMQNKLWTDQLQEDAKNIDKPQASLMALASLEDTYPKLSEEEKGAFWGKLPALSSNAQTIDRLAKIQSTANIRALQTGHITNTDFQIGDKLKADRSLNPASFNDAIAYSRALALRDIQEKRFHKEAFNKGMQNQDANDLWGKFIEQYPIFNPKTQKIIDKNYKISPFDVSYDNNANKAQASSTAPENNNAQSMAALEAKMPVSPGAKILASKIKLPDFNSKEDYEKWYAKQPKITKDAIKEYLRNRK